MPHCYSEVDPDMAKILEKYFVKIDKCLTIDSAKNFSIALELVAHCHRHFKNNGAGLARLTRQSPLHRDAREQKLVN